MKDKNILLTYIDQNYQENLEYDFLSTLRNVANYRGPVVVLDYGMDADRCNRIRDTYNVQIIPCSKDISLFSIRYLHIANILKSLGRDYDTVLVTDCGDVWYQDSIDIIFNQAAGGIACSEEDRVIGEDEWTRKCIDNLSCECKSEFLSITCGHNVNNSGVICGDVQVIIELFQRVYEDIVRSGIEFFGIDQLYFNYEWYKLEGVKKVSLDNKYNYVLVSHEDEYHVNEQGEIITNKGKKVTVVHNAGGNWRAITRPYINAYENYDQYVIENVYSIRQS